MYRFGKTRLGCSARLGDASACAPLHAYQVTGHGPNNEPVVVNASDSASVQNIVSNPVLKSLGPDPKTGAQTYSYFTVDSISDLTAGGFSPITVDQIKARELTEAGLPTCVPPGSTPTGTTYTSTTPPPASAGLLSAIPWWGWGALAAGAYYLAK